MSEQRTVRSTVLVISAAMLLVAGAGYAYAGRLSASGQNLRVTWAPLEIVQEGFAIYRCPVTLEGSLHSMTVSKVIGTLIGSITRAWVQQEGCSGARLSAFNGSERYNGTTAPNTLPWHLTYESFGGTLPTPLTVSFLLSRFRFGFRDSNNFCTGQYGAETDNVGIRAALGAGGVITSTSIVEGRDTITSTRRDGGIICVPLRLHGTGSVMVLGTTTRVAVTLI